MVFNAKDGDIGRKLDKGNDLLIDIKSDTSAIKNDTSSIKSDTSAIKSDTSSLPEIKNIMGSFVVEHREHNYRLEKILEKLAER